MDRNTVTEWVSDYERLWRTPGTGELGEIFTTDAVYVPSPWSPGIEGLPAIAQFWDDEREGPDEQFTMSSEVVAVDPPWAVVRVFVEYDDRDSWRDLWVLRLDQGRCARFEEWPFSPRRADSDEGAAASAP